MPLVMKVRGAGMKQQENKSYNPKDDPYFPIQARIIGRGADSTGLMVGMVLLSGGVVAVRRMGWIGLIGIIVAIILAVMVWLLIRKVLISAAAEHGYVNRHKMTTRECITPLEKRLNNRFYTMDCGNCGKSTTVQAINLRSKRCPHCRSKKIKY